MCDKITAPRYTITPARRWKNARTGETRGLGSALEGNDWEVVNFGWRVATIGRNNEVKPGWEFFKTAEAAEAKAREYAARQNGVYVG